LARPTTTLFSLVYATKSLGEPTNTTVVSTKYETLNIEEEEEEEEESAMI